MKKPLKQMINKGKNQQIEINKKPLNPEGIEEENRSAAVKPGYNVFAFLFRVLVAGQLRFYLAALINSQRGRAVGDVVSTKGEVIIGLLGLFL